jgi:thiosulfate reductase cytochrome b subunit
MHVYKAWKTKNNRLSGGFFLLLFTILILTGIGLFYSGVEYNRRLLSVLHWVIGILFPIFFVIHIYFGKFKR